jgi:hypothetical protein
LADISIERSLPPPNHANISANRGHLTNSYHKDLRRINSGDVVAEGPSRSS